MMDCVIDEPNRQIIVDDNGNKARGKETMGDKKRKGGCWRFNDGKCEVKVFAKSKRGSPQKPNQKIKNFRYRTG